MVIQGVTGKAKGDGTDGLDSGMKIDFSPLYLTYYMLDWTKVRQTRSSDDCVSCGKRMNRVEPIRDNKGQEYEGVVCHDCKTVLWFRS